MAVRRNSLKPCFVFSLPTSQKLDDPSVDGPPAIVIQKGRERVLAGLKPFVRLLWLNKHQRGTMLFPFLGARSFLGGAGDHKSATNTKTPALNCFLNPPSRRRRCISLKTVFTCSLMYLSGITKRLSEAALHTPPNCHSAMYLGQAKAFYPFRHLDGSVSKSSGRERLFLKHGIHTHRYNTRRARVRGWVELVYSKKTRQA